MITKSEIWKIANQILFFKIKINFKFPIFEAHFSKKMGSTEIVVRPSDRPSVSYFSAAIAPRDLNF
jgi:hypothetical protein